MRIAIVGGGVSGLVAASLLHEAHDVAVFEANRRIGGHAHTVDVASNGSTYGVDTGFVVYNERTYPLFTRLLARLGVETIESTMSFSVRCETSGLEYCGSSIPGLLARTSNLVRPSFLRMVRDILRFHRDAGRALDSGAARDATLGEFVRERRYSRSFVDHYLVPMSAAIWSMPAGTVLDFPLEFLVRFFRNHGMLTVSDRPVWRVVRGGSRTYVDALVRPFRDRIRLGARVSRVARLRDRVTVDGERFDHVVFACHSDEALRALADPTPLEREVLSDLPYQENRAVLHTDESLLPRRSRARAAWNAHVGTNGRDPRAPVAVTYDMSVLQSLGSRERFCVTLNRADAIDPGHRIADFVYHHPVATRRGVAARARQMEGIGGPRTHYCGAYWGYGFHEDGVRSAVAVAGRFGARFP